MSGADYAMEGFIKVSGRRADEGAVDGKEAEEAEKRGISQTVTNFLLPPFPFALPNKEDLFVGGEWVRM